MSILILKRQGRRAFPAPTEIETEQAPVSRARPLGVLIWPLGIAATGFLLAATMTIFIVWMPIVFFALTTDVLRRRRIEADEGVTYFG